MWQSCDHAWLWCKVVISLQIPQLRIFARNFFNKIGADASYLGYTSVKILLPLSCELWNQIRDLYSKLALYQLLGRGKPPSGHHFIPEATSLWRVMIKHKNKADYSSTQWTISPLLFSHRILLLIFCILNIFTADWGCNSILTKEAISSVMFFMFNI